MKQNIDERRETKDERTPVKMLGEVCYYPNQRIAIDDLAVGEYVGVEHLVKNKGGLERSTQMPDAENAIEFCVGDVLIGNIRPYLRKIWLADFRGGASGDVVVIRVKKEFENKIDPAYLYKVLSSELFFEYDNNNTKGAKMPRGDRKAIAKYLVPVPPLAEQQRIVAELDLLTGIIDKQNAQLKELDTLAQSIFYDMFGDPIENPYGFVVKTVGETCVLKSGDSSANKSPEGSLPYVKVGDMNLPENTMMITTSSTFVDREYNKKAIFPIGTTIFPKRGGAIFTNKKRLTAVEICCDLNIMGVIPSSTLTPMFVFHFFQGIDFGKICNGAAIPQLNNCDIGPLKILEPPLALQQSFADKIQSIEKQKSAIKASIADTQKLLDYTMDKYFG